MSALKANDPRIPAIQSSIRVVPDFPKPDITTLVLDPKVFKDTVDLFVERYKSKNISVVAGIEARGFIFGTPIALAIGAKFVPYIPYHDCQPKFSDKSMIWNTEVIVLRCMLVLWLPLNVLL